MLESLRDTNEPFGARHVYQFQQFGLNLCRWAIQVGIHGRWSLIPLHASV